MSTLIQALWSAVVAGAGYGLLAIGFSLAYKTTGVINFAHGELALLAAYVCLALVSIQVPLALAALASVGAAAAAGGLMERIVLRPLYGRPVVGAILATVGVSIVISSSIQLIWGNVPRSVPTLASDEAWRIGPVSLSAAQIALISVALVVAAVVVVIVDRTRVGRALRGLAQDREAVSLLGIPPARLYLLSFVVAGAAAGLAGVLIAPTIGLVPSRGLSLTVFAFAAAVLGGLGSLSGAIVGGMLLSLLRTFAAVYLAPEYADAVTYMVIILVLLVRVRGLFGDEVETLRRV